MRAAFLDAVSLVAFVRVCYVSYRIASMNGVRGFRSLPDTWYLIGTRRIFIPVMWPVSGSFCLGYFFHVVHDVIRSRPVKPSLPLVLSIRYTHPAVSYSYDLRVAGTRYHVPCPCVDCRPLNTRRTHTMLLQYNTK